MVLSLASVPSSSPLSTPAKLTDEQSRFAAAHVGLARAAANRAAIAWGLDYDDLIGPAHLGLVRAARAFFGREGRSGSFANYGAVACRRAAHRAAAKLANRRVREVSASQLPFASRFEKSIFDSLAAIAVEEFDDDGTRPK